MSYINAVPMGITVYWPHTLNLFEALSACCPAVYIGSTDLGDEPAEQAWEQQDCFSQGTSPSL